MTGGAILEDAGGNALGEARVRTSCKVGEGDFGASGGKRVAFFPGGGFVACIPPPYRGAGSGSFLLPRSANTWGD